MAFRSLDNPQQSILSREQLHHGQEIVRSPPRKMKWHEPDNGSRICHLRRFPKEYLRETQSVAGMGEQLLCSYVIAQCLAELYKEKKSPNSNYVHLSANYSGSCPGQCMRPFATIDIVRRHPTISSSLQPTPPSRAPRRNSVPGNSTSCCARLAR